MLQLQPLLRELTIQTKRLELVKFPLADSGEYSEFAWAQRRLITEIERQYNLGLPVRVIILKARQLGISTLTEGVMFNWCFLHPGTNGLVVAHESPASEGLFQKTKLYWETWPLRRYYTQKYATRHQLTWLETRSNLQVATAKNVGAGRSSTINALHGSEVAFWPNPDDLMTGLKQSIPDEHGSFVILESTANGVGNFWHETWLEAEAGDNEYKPLFFPWFHHYEYTRPTTLCTKLELSVYEKWLLSQGATYPHIEWLRWCVPNKVKDDQARMQEYPSTPEEAFISTGHPIFGREPLKACFTEKDSHGRRLGVKGFLVADHRERTGFRFIPDAAAGELTIYKAPSRRDLRPDLYFVAGDPSMTIEGDPASIQVINRATMEQVAVWHGRIDPGTFAEKMMEIGYFYNTAMLCPEIEGGGQGTIQLILSSGYPSIWTHRWADKSPGKLSQSYGWSTNFQRKSLAIGKLQKLIHDLSLKIHDKKTYIQLLNYVVHNNGEWGPVSDSIHDDAVMALSIAVTASIMEGPVSSPFSESTSNVVDIFNQEDEHADPYVSEVLVNQ